MAQEARVESQFTPSISEVTLPQPAAEPTVSMKTIVPSDNLHIPWHRRILDRQYTSHSVGEILMQASGINFGCIGPGVSRKDHKTGIRDVAYFLVGNDYETLDEIRELLDNDPSLHHMSSRSFEEHFQVVSYFTFDKFPKPSVSYRRERGYGPPTPTIKAQLRKGFEGITMIFISSSADEAVKLRHEFLSGKRNLSAVRNALGPTYR